MSTDYSRPLSVAYGSTADAVGLESRLQETAIMVTCDDRAHRSTLDVLVTNLRRLPVALHLPSRGSAALSSTDLEQMIANAAEIDRDRPILLDLPHTPSLHLHVGANPCGAHISAIADGHGTRLRRRGQPFPVGLTRGTGLGSALTAATLTAEAFKEIVGVLPNRHRSHEKFDFNPITLGADGPVLPFPTLDDTALIGSGAIGTAIALILRESGTEGTMTVVDPESFDLPNVMTYSLGTRRDADSALHKTELLARELPRIDVRRVEGTAQDLINRIDDGSATMPLTVLGAVDSVQARHEIAKIYADLVLDGSTGGTAGSAVGLVEAVPDGPCLRCYYPSVPKATGPSPEQQLSDMTGLPITVLADGGRALSAEDIRDLQPEGSRLLAKHLGKPICGLARTLGLTGPDDTFRPSAAFVSQQAAALVVGALVARVNSNVERLRDIEYDALFGPTDAMVAHRRERLRCSCQTDKRLIEQIRNSRRH
jgi:hypothetical protein